MRCNQCGAENTDDVKFCISCGAEIKVPEKNIQKKKSYKILIIIGLFAAAAVVIMAGLFGLQKKQEKQYADKLDEGQKYLQDLEYEKAEASFLEAIEIDPKQSDAYMELGLVYDDQDLFEKAELVYQAATEIDPNDGEAHYNLGHAYKEQEKYEEAEESYLAAIDLVPEKEEGYLDLAEIYNKQGRYEEEQELLEKGLDKSGSEKIEKAAASLNENRILTTYAEEVLGKNKCELGPYAAEYVSRDGIHTIGRPAGLNGTIATYIRDFDGDGTVELLAVMVEQDGTTILDVPNYIIRLVMYEAEADEVVEAASYRAWSEVLGGADAESDWLFLQEYEGVTYICGNAHGLNYIIADGSGLQLFALSYQNGNFTEIVRDEAGGSTFQHLGDEFQVVAKKLRGIGLNASADMIIDEYWLAYSDEEEVETLMRICGDNVYDRTNYIMTEKYALTEWVYNYDVITRNPVVLQIYLEEDAVLEASRRKEADAILNELYELDEKANTLYSEAASSETAAYQDIYSLWNEKMEAVYKKAEQSLSEDQQTALAQNQQQWQTQMEAEQTELKAAGSQEADLYQAKYSKAREQCYRLTGMLKCGRVQYEK
ncbi:MAG: tetratricopeptide repeat protein [Lachnospiraceae bacterium]